MFDIGFSELLLCGIIALLVLGPERLPKAARTAGLVIGKIKRSVSGLQEELERQVRLDELKEKLENPEAIFMDEDERQAKISAEEAATATKEATQTSPSDSSNKTAS